MNYKRFGHSGLRVSELCLGTMTFGEEWGWGADFDTSKQIFDAYADAGGNFIDTANRYTEGTSERYLADFLAKDRDHFVLATKYSLFDRHGDLNFCGNNRRNLMRSVEGSLQRLKTEVIDLLWVHAWDFTTGVEEVMRGLDDLVAQGKVHYIGISDTPAWIVARANTLAELRGWSRFAGLQIEYSLLQRTPERDLLPMAQALDLAVTPWAPLAGGALTGKYLNNEEGRLKPESDRLNERSRAIAQAVVDIAKEMDVSPAQVAVRWTMEQHPQIIPIVGARKVKQITDSLGASDIQLSEVHLHTLNEVSAVEMGFPHDFLAKEGVQEVLFAGARKQLV